MSKEEKELRIAYWYKKGMECFKEWLTDINNKTLWGAFVCCSSAIIQYDKNHIDERTQKLQSKAWRFGYMLKECTLEEYQNSGYFNEKLFKKK